MSIIITNNLVTIQCNSMQTAWTTASMLVAIYVRNAVI
jgi:hypothetical protein